MVLSKRKKKEEDEEEMNGGDEASSGRDGLLYTLVQRLQVCRPVLVLRKPLVMSYLRRHQNYLGITRGEYDRCFRRPGLLTADEDGDVHGPDGLPVRALDRRGVQYRMVLAHLGKTYRLRAGWGRFLRNAGVRQDDGRHVGDVVEVWAFRSPAWDDAKLGLVLLHYTKEEDAQMTVELFSSSAGYHHRHLPAIVKEEEEEEEDDDDDDDEDDGEEAMVMSAAITLVSMKRN